MKIEKYVVPFCKRLMACGNCIDTNNHRAFSRFRIYLHEKYGLSPESDFAHASSNVKTPGSEADVMGDYLPKTTYMSVAEFEAMGCDNEGFAQPEGRPDLPTPIWGTEQTIKPAYQRSQLRPGSEVPPKLFGILKLLGSLSK